LNPTRRAQVRASTIYSVSYAVVGLGHGYLVLLVTVLRLMDGTWRVASNSFARSCVRPAISSALMAEDGWA
jgi:hypothetical protein